jgi:hypothetical protein
MLKCPGCGGDIMGSIQRKNDRLAAEEALATTTGRKRSAG